ncbi:hypothetical protein AMIS_73680 [Actinoplanes missouriensis 431]|uniref:Uncharacterized protein n=1 Tax=Actinoplanes missouriensis (strain ATCC 14538 / DSM 43046 / CBS 188.64 / JCM 3121 / NBRC 102363 / NCIMB 12654 / NRRL B-3342 / UNCC 431) TaxID=512565 RepID=I0HHV1_ACTM4|nr:hypothetical protein [Actinoplanes missouriensis]BAL92588.1 hypothetical protein AMIS_73680 [Actinoplanes missouriensis 431]
MTAPETVEQQQPARAPREPWHGWDTVVRVAGVVVAVIATLVTAVFELELTTLRSGGVSVLRNGESLWTSGGFLIPIAIPVAIGANLVIAWFAVTVTGRRWALGPPWALWTLIMLAAAGTRTTEGDYLLSGDNWVALVMILTGSLAYAVYSYRMILKPVAAKATDSGLSGSL